MPTTFDSPLATGLRYGWQATSKVARRSCAERAKASYVLNPTSRQARQRNDRSRLPAIPMSEITVTLPDGSSRRVRAGGHCPATWRHSISPGLAKAALAATVDGRLVDLTLPLTDDARLTLVTDRNPEALRALSAQHRAPAGGRGDPVCSPARSAASVRRPTKASSTTSSSIGRSCPKTSTRSRRR